MKRYGSAKKATFTFRLNASDILLINRDNNWSNNFRLDATSNQVTRAFQRNNHVVSVIVNQTVSAFVRPYIEPNSDARLKFVSLAISVYFFPTTPTVPSNCE